MRVTAAWRMLGVVLAITLWVGVCGSARAGGMVTPPAEALAWWRFDPTSFAGAQAAQARADGAPGQAPGPAPGPGGQVVLAGLRAAVGSGLLGTGTPAQVVEGLLAASEVGTVPHTLCLMDFAATRKPDGTGMVPQRLQMVLELRAQGDHARFVRLIRTLLVDAPAAKGEPKDAGAARQRELALPGGITGVAFTREGWGEWREVSWTSAPGVFTVGLGRGALERWLGERGDEAGAWARHEATVDAARPAGRAFFSAFLHLDGMRSRFPLAFASGRTPRLLATLGLTEAREVMVHGRLIETQGEIPPLLVLDATVGGADAGAAVERRALSESAWPDGELVMTPPPGSFVLVSKMDWMSACRLGVDLYACRVKNDRLAAFMERRTSWESAHGAALEALLGGFRGWLVMSDVPTPVLPAPGMGTVFVETREGVTAETMSARMDAVMAGFADRVSTDGAAAARIWSLKIDDRGVVRLPAWGFASPPGAPALLVGGWGAPVVTMNRERVGEGNAESSELKGASEGAGRR